MWTFAGGMVSGVAIGFLLGEYYRRIIDAIRREQINDLRRERPEAWDGMERSQRRARSNLISQEQFDEMRSTGHTAGRRMGSANE